MKKRTLSVLLILCLLVSLLSLPGIATASAGTHRHTVCGRQNCYDSSHGHGSASVTYTALSQSDINILGLRNGSYFLTEDITLSDGLSISGTVNLCLNGHALKGTANKSILGMSINSTLNLCDCNGSGSTHKFSVDSNGLWTLDESNGTKAVTGGVITGGHNGVCLSTGSTSNASITFNMYGGTIAGNHAVNSYGGGVYVYGKGTTFHMYGGSILGNSSTYYGGAVYLNSGACATFSGATISGNTTGQCGGGVYASDTAVSVSIKNTTISGNTAREGGGAYIAAPLTLSGSVTINGNTGTISGNNLYVDSPITISDSLTGSSIAVSCARDVFTTGAGTYGLAAENQSVFIADRKDQYIVVDGTGTAAELMFKIHPQVYFSCVFDLGFSDEDWAAMPDTQSVPIGNTAERPNDPAIRGYDFDDWYYWDDTEETLALFDFDTPITEDITLLANFIPYGITRHPSEANGYSVSASGNPTSYQWYLGSSLPILVADFTSDTTVAADNDFTDWEENAYSSYADGAWTPAITYQDEHLTEGLYFTLDLKAGDLLTISFDEPIGTSNCVAELWGNYGNWVSSTITFSDGNVPTQVTTLEFRILNDDTYVLYASVGEGYTLSPVTATRLRTTIGYETPTKTVPVTNTKTDDSVYAESDIAEMGAEGPHSTFADGMWLPYAESYDTEDGIATEAYYFLIDLQDEDILTVTFEGDLPEDALVIVGAVPMAYFEENASDGPTFSFTSVGAGRYFFKVVSQNGPITEWPAVSATVTCKATFTDLYDFSQNELTVGTKDSKNTVKVGSVFDSVSYENYDGPKPIYSNSKWSPLVESYEEDGTFEYYAFYFNIDMWAGEELTITFDTDLPDGALVTFGCIPSERIDIEASEGRTFSFVPSFNGNYSLIVQLTSDHAVDWPAAKATLARTDYSKLPSGLQLVGDRSTTEMTEAWSDFSDLVGEDGRESSFANGVWTPTVVFSGEENLSSSTAGYFIVDLTAGDTLYVVFDHLFYNGTKIYLWEINNRDFFEWDPHRDSIPASFPITYSGQYVLYAQYDYSSPEGHNYPSARAMVSTAEVSGQNTYRLSARDSGSYLCEVGYADGTVVYSQSVTITSTQSGMPGVIPPGVIAPPVIEGPGASQSGSTITASSFTDVPQSAWYRDAVDYVAQEGLMKGTSDTAFEPNSNATRAMIMTILHRLEGTPYVGGTTSFKDVKEGTYYFDAVLWAEKHSITNGLSDEIFAPNQEITGEQLATMLYRYVQYCGGGFKGLWAFRLDFADAEKVSDWAYEAMCWMTMKGIIQGKNGNRLDPQGFATRAEIAQVLARFAQLEI